MRPKKQTCPKQLPVTVSVLKTAKPILISGPLSKRGVMSQVEINGSGFTLAAAKRNEGKHSGLQDCTNIGSKTCMDSVQKNLNRLETYTDSVSGYFDGKVWHSFLCNNRIKTLDAAQHCFHNKTIYFIGDSTSRQLHVELTSFLNMSDKQFGNPQFYSNPRKAEDRGRNLIIHYKAHGLPFINRGSRTSHPPIVETLSSITNDNPDIIVVLNIGPHYTLHPPNVFIQRIPHIKRAIESLRQRLPNVKIFVKGSVRNRNTYARQPSEWLLYRLERILLKMLCDVTYIDTWSMTTVQPQETVHADSEMLRHFLALIFSHVCA